MVLYYKGKFIDTIREYTYGHELMAEIEVGGERLYVPRKELTEKPTTASVQPEEKPKAVTKTVKEKVEVAVEDIVETEPKETRKSKKVYLATNGKTQLRFENVNDANVRRYKFDKKSIEAVINGEQKSHKGFTFEVE